MSSTRSTGTKNVAFTSGKRASSPSRSRAKEEPGASQPAPQSLPAERDARCPSTSIQPSVRSSTIRQTGASASPGQSARETSGPCPPPGGLVTARRLRRPARCASSGTTNASSKPRPHAAGGADSTFFQGLPPHWGSGAVWPAGGTPAEAPPSQSISASWPGSLLIPSEHWGFSRGAEGERQPGSPGGSEIPSPLASFTKSILPSPSLSRPSSQRRDGERSEVSESEAQPGSPPTKSTRPSPSLSMPSAQPLVILICSGCRYTWGPPERVSVEVSAT